MGLSGSSCPGCDIGRIAAGSVASNVPPVPEPPDETEAPSPGSEFHGPSDMLAPSQPDSLQPESQESARQLSRNSKLDASGSLRKDRKGNPISPRKNAANAEDRVSFHVSFADAVNAGPVADVVPVEQIRLSESDGGSSKQSCCLPFFWH
mmetsp:Transcript_17790/g.31139  ORF Transcript_17790/g.31139 Transcript_17790/m.31139 type:complete len:150 (+) Transcript_17790:46-495(+)